MTHAPIPSSLQQARTTLAALYPALGSVIPQQEQLCQDWPATPLDVPTGQTLFREHEPCQGFPLVLAGEIQVSRHSEDGRQLELYRVVPGELCLVSSASLFRGQPLAASGITTRATRLVMINPELFHQWLAIAEFRSQVLGLFAERMTELMSLVDAVAFQRLDQRLAGALLGHGPVLAITHRVLADQLGTVREIVTRLLRRFERDGWVELSREQILIKDSHALRTLAQGH